jgi:hypothetical protein
LKPQKVHFAIETLIQINIRAFTLWVKGPSTASPNVFKGEMPIRMVQLPIIGSIVCSGLN